jgi:uncharacterized protein (TIGR00369 family)
MEKQTDSNETCFLCGTKNEKGLKLDFSYPEPGQAETQCIIPDYFSGWKKITHGGFLAMLLDETMAHACLSKNILAVTANMSVRYIKPVYVGNTVTVKAEIREINGRLIYVGGEILDKHNNKISSSSGRFMSID